MRFRVTLLAVLTLIAFRSDSATISVKRGDRKPAVTWVALDSAGKRVDLTGATASFRMRDPISGCTIVGDAKIPNTKTGNLRYDWKLGDTDFAGSYEGEFLLTFPDLTTWTFPTVGTISITVEPNAANPTPNNPSIYCQGSAPIPVQHGVTGDPATGLIPQGLHVFRYRGIGYKDMHELYTGIIGPGAWSISTSGQPSSLHPNADNDRDVGKADKRPRNVYAATALLLGGAIAWPSPTGVRSAAKGTGAPSATPIFSTHYYLRTDGPPYQYLYDGSAWAAGRFLPEYPETSPLTSGAGTPTGAPAAGTFWYRTDGPPSLYVFDGNTWVTTDYFVLPVAGFPATQVAAGTGAPNGAAYTGNYLRTDGPPSQYVCSGGSCSSTAWVPDTVATAPVTSGAGVPSGSATDGDLYLMTAGGGWVYKRASGAWSITTFATGEGILPDPIAAIPPRQVTSGAGAPSGSCSPSGSLYLRSDGGAGSTMYVCEGTTWAAK